MRLEAWSAGTPLATKVALGVARHPASLEPIEPMTLVETILLCSSVQEDYFNLYVLLPEYFNRCVLSVASGASNQR